MTLEFRHSQTDPSYIVLSLSYRLTETQTNNSWNIMKKTPLLHAESHGNGPVVVFLHGFLSSSKYWRKVSELISQNYRVVTIDLLGFGDSPKPGHSKYDYEAHISSINKTLYAQNVREPFILVGHSMGALLALRYANIYANRVTKLILTNMPVMLGKKEVKFELFNANIIYRLGLSPFTHHFMWQGLRILYKLRWLPSEAIDRLTMNIDYVFKHSARSRLRSFRRVIMRAKADVDLATIGVKTIVLSGIDDKKVYVDNLVSKVQLSPYVAMQNFKTGHHIPLLMPELLAETIRE